MNRRDRIMEKILRRVCYEPAPPLIPGHCWVWQGADSGSGRGGGYPRMSLDGATVAVHRVVWTHYAGYIPPGKQIDHQCCNRMCVNPAHLLMVTHKTNQKLRDERRSTPCLLPVDMEDFA